MNSEDHQPAPPKPKLDETLVCDVCGRFGAVEIGDRRLCPECYEGCGSCCPEFGKDDLTADNADDADKPR